MINSASLEILEKIVAGNISSEVLPELRSDGIMSDFVDHFDKRYKLGSPRFVCLMFADFTDDITRNKFENKSLYSSLNGITGETLDFFWIGLSAFNGYKSEYFIKGDLEKSQVFEFEMNSGYGKFEFSFEPYAYKKSLEILSGHGLKIPNSKMTLFIVPITKNRIMDYPNAKVLDISRLDKISGSHLYNTMLNVQKFEKGDLSQKELINMINDNLKVDVRGSYAEFLIKLMGKIAASFIKR